MRKFLISLAAAGAAVAVASPAAAQYYPAPQAYGYGYNELKNLTDYKNMNWGININWNIFDAFRTNESLQGAVARRRNAEISLAQAERNITVDVKKALLDLEAARKQYDVSQKGLQSATMDRKIAEERYNLGAGTLLDLLVASANLVNAQANQVNASYNFIIAKRNMEYVLGERQY